MRGLSRREFVESCPPPWVGFHLAAVSSAGGVVLEELGWETELEWENGTNVQLSKGGILSVLLECEGSAKMCSEKDGEA